MSEPTHGTSVAAPHLSDDDWLTVAAAEPLESTTPEPMTPRRMMLVRGGLVAAGVVVGAVVVASISHGGSTDSTPTAAVGAPGATGQLPGGGQFAGGGPGGLAGEQRLDGTLVSVGSSSVTVKTSAGTATYTVTSGSEIVRNGQAATLSALHAGDTVFVHVYPSGSGSQMVIERLFATSAGNT